MKALYRWAGFTQLLIILSFTQSEIKAQTPVLPSGFSQVKVASLDQASAMAFAPDGRLFVCQKTGAVRVIKNGSLLSTPFVTLSVDINGERGISGIAFDPNFNTNHYVYIYYTAKTPSIHNRLSRFTANGDVVQSGSEVALLDAEPVTAIYHNGGGMGFGIDGKLYLAIGEDNKPSNSQNMGTYKGKLLRLNPDGTAPSDNPYYSSTNPITKKIWCIGLRNPYTLAIQPGTGRIFVNNVGADNYEEIHDATQPGQNFGWPAVEGYSSDPAYDNPFFAYPHESTSGVNGCAVCGGAFFNTTNTNYPAQYQNKYFYQDFCDRWIYYVSTSGSLNNTVFATNLVTQNLALQVGPDGNLYYLNRYDTKAGVYKIIYTNNNAPVITNHPASQSITEGQPVTFSVTASGAVPLSYQWKKNGVNISGANSSTYSISSVQQPHAGQYSVLVSNSAGSALSNSATLTVTEFNAPPTAVINSPANGTLYTAGDIISFTADATDPEDGTLPASAFNWTVEFHHNNDHFHPGPVIPSGIKSGSFTIPNTGEPSANVFYRLILIVTDADGLRDTTQIDLLPRTSNLTFNSVPAGLKFTFDSQPKTTPFSFLAVEGINVPIGAVSPQTMNGQAYAFDHWGHGGPATQTITVGTSDNTYTIYYKDTTLSCSASGSITRELWTNKSSSSLSASEFSTTPNSTIQLTKFEGPSSSGDNYNSRIRGFICAPQTGNYTFWIASDNNSELWLSTDENPANKVKIASVATYTGSKEWTKFSSQQSAPIQLIQGGKYYIEALHHEGTRGDNLAVGWQLPDGTMERPIPGTRLSPHTGGSSEPPPAPASELISAGASWKYLDNGTDQGTSWRSLSFSETGWKTGNAQLGYGDGDEATTVSYGSSSSSKYITTYFRKKFNVTSLSSITGLELHLLRDDGAVVYINGIEVLRNNMPSTAITYTTRAVTYIDGANEDAFNVHTLSPSVLVEGENIIAVEIHQNSSSSSDISFDLKLKTSGTSGGGGTVSVNITSPTNNATFSSPTNITINANASTTSGSITKVEFYSADVKIGEDLTAPWSFTWENVTTGNYELKAKAYTSGGLNATSAVVNVLVNTCSTPTITPSGPLKMCSGSVVLNSNTGTGFSYQWIKDGTNISGATAPSYTASSSGNYQVRIIVGSCAAWSAPTKVSIGSGLAASITPGGPTTFCQGGSVVLYGNTCSGYSYQWKRNGSDISGAIASTYTATVGGEYQLKVTQNGVKAWSSKLLVTVNNCTAHEMMFSNTETQTTVGGTLSEDFDMKVFPNPNTGQFTINIKMPVINTEKVTVRIVNLLGEQVFTQELAATENITETIQLDGSLKSGVYSLQVIHGDKMESLNVVLAR